MSQVHVNPEVLHQFSVCLDRFRAELHAQMQNLQGNFHTLGDTWRDQQREKFAGEFEMAMRTLQKFLLTTEKEHLPYLRKKIELARSFLHG